MGVPRNVAHGAEPELIKRLISVTMCTKAAKGNTVCSSPRCGSSEPLMAIREPRLATWLEQRSQRRSAKHGWLVPQLRCSSALPAQLSYQPGWAVCLPQKALCSSWPHFSVTDTQSYRLRPAYRRSGDPPPLTGQGERLGAFLRGMLPVTPRTLHTSFVHPLVHYAVTLRSRCGRAPPRRVSGYARRALGPARTRAPQQ